MENDEHLLSALKNKKYWQHEADEVCLAATVKLHRNVETHIFPGKLKEDDRLKVMELIKQTLIQEKVIENPLFLSAHSIIPIVKEFLFEHFFCLDGFHQAHKGEGFCLSQDGHNLLIFNVRDHLQLMHVDYAGQLEKAWNQLLYLETQLSSQLKFTYNKKFGYLNSDLNHCGTGLKAAIMLHVPALSQSNSLDSLLKSLQNESISFETVNGKYQAFAPDVVVVKNHYTLGVSEEDIIGAVRRCATKITVAEKTLRNKILLSKDLFFQDKIYKALGILKNSQLLTLKEALESLSLINLGLSFKWLQGASVADCKNLMLTGKRGHLLLEQSEGEISADLLRSKLLKSVLNKVSIVN